VALGRAEQLAAQAGALDPKTAAEAKAAVGMWQQAEAAVAQAEAAAESGNAEMARRVAEQATVVRGGLKKARRDADLLDAMEVVEATPYDNRGGHWDEAKKVRVFRAALAAAGLPSRLPQKEDAADMAAAIQAERSGVQTALLATIDRLVLFPPTKDLHDGFEFAAWLEIANRCDDHPFRREVRTKCQAAIVTKLVTEEFPLAPTAPPLPDPPVKAPELLRLMDRAEAEDAPTDAIIMIADIYGYFVEDTQGHARLRRLLRAARDRHQTDIRLHERIGWTTDAVWWGTGDPRLAEESIGCARMSIALRPDRAEGHYTLGTDLGQLGDYDQAVLHLRDAIDRNRNFTFARINLATALYYRGDLDGAEKVLRDTIPIDHCFTRAHADLGRVLWARGDFDAAVQCFVKAHEVQPEIGGLVAYLATFLRKTGRFAKAREIIRKWLDRAKKDDPNRARVEDALKKLERAAEAEAKVAAVLAGQDPAADNEERLLLAERCFCLRHEAAAARLYAAAFAADPALATFTYRMPNNDVFIAPRQTSNRYNAALAAARAGGGSSADSGKPTPDQRTALRAQALDWLRAELAVLRKQATSTVWPEKLAADFHLRLWLVEPALAQTRPGPTQLDLPTAERAAWDELWREVQDTIILARHPPPPPSRPEKP
jgi:tetratricopeptide (TPR) repeat protein